LDAGLVVAHKASLDLEARLRLLAQPVSLATSESSGGQEDYMSMSFPAIARLYEMADLVTAMLAYELLAGLAAIDQRGERPGDGVSMVRTYFRRIITPLERDRPPGPDVERLLQAFDTAAFHHLLASL
jgi:histidine ammonia-lyase